jgi:DNA-binding MarR family transcriptional regulator
MATGKGRAKRAEAGDSPAPADVPDLASIIGYKLRRAQLMVFQDFIDSFARMPLRPAEFSVLALIARTPGLKQSDIAAKLGIKRANFVALMDGLERRGLAERRKAEGDKRSHSVHLTDAGHGFVAQMVAVWEGHEQRLVDRLGGTAERDTLIGLLDRIIGPAD